LLEVFHRYSLRVGISRERARATYVPGLIVLVQAEEMSRTVAAIQTDVVPSPLKFIEILRVATQVQEQQLVQLRTGVIERAGSMEEMKATARSSNLIQFTLEDLQTWQLSAKIR
jgi:hypothetical protein